MSYLIRSGALNRMLEQSAAVHKADAPRRPMTADEVAEDHDALLTSLGGKRFFVDDRAAALAKHDAAEAHRRHVAKADADRDASRAAPAFVLPSEQKRREAADAPSVAARSDFAKSLPGAKAEFQGAKADFEASMAKIIADFKLPTGFTLGDDTDDDTDDDGSEGGAPATAVREPPPKVKPGTSNAVHTPSADGVYAKQDRRSTATVHTVNRRIGPARVSKAASPATEPFIDLSTWFGRPAR